MRGRRNGPDEPLIPVRPGELPPPHSPEAETALLGAILVDPAAISDAAEHLKADDFFHPSNQKVFAAMLALSEKGVGIDPVTITNALREMGELDAVGGMAFVSGLMSEAGPSTSVEYYAAIIRDKAAVRRMIAVASNIVSQGYQPDVDPGEFFDQAESKLFAAGEVRLRGGVIPLDVALDNALERLEKLRAQHAHITGVPTQYRNLDGKLLGFQKSDLIILAARPSMGKTSVALNLALNAALAEPNNAVLFASLEMNEPQITNRLLCIKAGVESNRLRSGFLAGAEMDRLREVREWMRGTPLFIDDAPKLGLMELRAKARRMATKGQLDMILIDYLQLMEPSDKKISREQQISEISRGLKALAKELNVPIIALSQLSRAVETRPGKDKRPMLSDLRECVTGDTLVCLADGRRVPIQDLVGSEPDVVSVDEARRLGTSRADKVWPVGRRPVFRVDLASGRSLRATAEHRLLAWDGWTAVRALAPGDRLALARRLPAPPDALQDWPDSRVALLGHLVGDGSYLVHQPLRYTTADERNAAAVTEGAEELGCVVTRHAGRGNWFQLVLSGNGNRWHPAGVGAWLRGLGIFGQRSHQKRLPTDVFRFSDRHVALLLRHLWATDGTIHVRPDGNRGSATVNFSTCSQGLAFDVAALLLRLGIVARIREVVQRVGRPVFTVSVSGSQDQTAFLDRVGSFGPRVEPANRLRTWLAGKEAGTNVDTLPIDAWQDVRSAMGDSHVTQRQMAALRGTSYGGTAHFKFAPSRETYRSYAEALGAPRLAARAEEEIFWDRVVTVVPAGEEDVFDLTVPGPACWLADGIVSHNSGAIEQDADVVLFLYRPEYYDPKDKPVPEHQNLLEIIIAKQRNGPTGIVNLTFIPETMQVADRMDEVQPLD